MNKLSILALAAGLFMVSCGKVPVAAFKASSTNVYPSQSVTFTASSTDAKGQMWSFGDGATDITESPSHAYTAPGQYLVEYMATSKKKGGKSDKASVMITVWPWSHKYMGEYNYVSKHYGSASTSGSYLGDVGVMGISNSGLLADNEVYVDLPGMPFGIKATVTSSTLVLPTTATQTQVTYNATTPSTTTTTTYSLSTTTATVGTDGSIHYTYLITTTVVVNGGSGVSGYDTYDIASTKI